MMDDGDNMQGPYDLLEPTIILCHPEMVEGFRKAFAMFPAVEIRSSESFTNTATWGVLDGTQTIVPAPLLVWADLNSKEEWTDIWFSIPQ